MDNDKNYLKVPKIVFVVVLVVAAGLLGWFLRSDSPSTQTNTEPRTADNEVSNEGVASLVSYTLPDGWREGSCESAPEAVYITPAGAGSIDCSANPSSPVKISVDNGNTKDCNELQTVTDVKKHICVSLFINNQRSLNATTEHLASSSYGQPTTIHAYYVDIGTDVIKAEYAYTTDNQYQAGFDQLVRSIKKS